MRILLIIHILDNQWELNPTHLTHVRHKLIAFYPLMRYNLLEVFIYFWLL